MEMMLIYAWIILTATVNFSFAFVFGGVNKVFMGVYKSAIESTVINFNTSGYEVASSFSHDKIEINVRSYFETNLKKYVSKYDLKIDYYNHLTGEKNLNNPTEIDIYLKTKIAYVGDYQKSASFYIGEGKSNG